MFDLARISAAGLIGSVDFHESLGSTNDRALELAAAGTVELPLLVLTERQTAGRGRGTNPWWAGNGALTFSLVLEAPGEKLPMQRWPQAALVAGLAVCEALEHLAPGADVSVKWPNDVFLGGRKVCGILSESVPGWRERLVVGIGVNVNNRVQNPGVEVPGPGSKVQGTNVVGGQRSEVGGRWIGGSGQPVALVEWDGMVRDLTETLLAVLEQFDRRWGEFLEGGFGPLAEAYRRRCFLTGKSLRIEQPGARQIVGVCRGISDEGLLLVLSENGEERVASGTVARWES